MRVGQAALAGILGACLAAPAAGAAVIGQGGVRMGADAMWSRGLLGQGQTVAIVDQGFAGLDRSIELGELPPRDRLQVRLFDPGGAEGGLTELGLPTQHGVRMAELIHDLAPDARLVLVGYRTQEQFAEAASWICTKDQTPAPFPTTGSRRFRTIATCSPSGFKAIEVPGP